MRRKPDECHSVSEEANRVIRRKAQELIGKAGLVGADRDDIEQELRLDLARRLPRFDPDRSQIQTFTRRVVDNRVATLLEARRAALRDHRRVVHFEESAADGGAPGDEGAERVVDLAAYRRHALDAGRDREEHVDLARDLHRATCALPPDLQELCWRLTTDNVTEISRDTGVPRPTIYARLAEVRAHFERAGLRVYLDQPDTSGSAPVGDE
jgi:RNA polymerase sigma-70 factor (ECF subfamily)